MKSPVMPAVALFCLTLLLCALILSCHPRYELNVTTHQGVSYKLDRWSGEVALILLDKEMAVEKAKR